MTIQNRSEEDRWTIATLDNIKYFAVFDGHGCRAYQGKLSDKHVVLYVKEYLHKKLAEALFDINMYNVNKIAEKVIQVFLEMDRFFQENNYDYGCTATIVLVTNLYVIQINLGDSRSVIFSGSEIIRETTDHNPDKEIVRIARAGGHIWRSSIHHCYRINYEGIAVSRAFGDFEYKHVTSDEGKYNPEGLVSVIPDVIINTREPGQLVLLGSDGLFEGFGKRKQSQPIINKINKFLAINTPYDEICSMIIDIAKQETSDDITMILAAL